MRHIRRLTAVLASLLYAQVLWAGSGFACAMASMPAAAHYPAASMAGMDMSADMTGMEMPGASAQQSGEGTTHHHTPCESPSAPADCESMMPCAPLALASVEELPRAPHGVPSAVAPLTVLTPPSQVSPPELPPPRA
jgi:hypothetical protein